MKKLIICLAIAALGTLSAVAQDGERIFKRFKGDVSLGYAAPLGASTNLGSNGGVLFAMEPKFAVMDNLSLGLRIEAAVMAKFVGSDVNGNAQLEDAKAAASYVATADYYFTNNYSFRPFAGAGAGFFATADDNINTDTDHPPVRFGGIIRVGAEVKHFRFGVELNLIPVTDYLVMAYDNMGNTYTTTGKSKNSYIGIKVGFCFGGGPL